MNRETKISLGIAMAMAGLWGGAYLCHIHDSDWQAIPAWFTGAALVISGVAMTMWGISDD